MAPPVSHSVRGKWDAKTSGGCPRNTTWIDNPQFLLLPPSAGTYSISLRCAASPKLDIGFVVLRQEAKDKAGRKTSTKVRKSELVSKTKWRTTDQISMEVELPEPAPGRGYIVLPCTFEPGPQAGFELQAVNAAGEEFSLMPIGDEPPAPPVASTPFAATTNAAANAASAGPSGGASAAALLAAPGGAPGDPYAAPDMKPTDASAGPLAEGEVAIKSEGQGLSAAQKRDAAAMVQEAVAKAAGGLYTDPDFPAAASSLWINGTAPGEALVEAGITADTVQSWKRPSEFGAPFAETDGEPRLFYTEWGTQGVVASPLLDHWLLAACNIVGGDVEILERVFVDAEHAASGFYAVRFYVDDPNSDDDWKVVLVDDLLPCGADGLPCFARCPCPVVLWISIIEKAFAKLQGSYEATAGGSVEDGLLYLTGGMSREVGIAQSADPAMVDALWQQMMEWWTTAHVIGCEHRIDSEPSAELQATGLLPNTPYCVITGGEPMGAGRMVRLRTFHGYSEWNGKWSDQDPRWTSRLRQSLAYSNDGDDGTFWMGFDDFVTWFNVLFTCRMADDRWTTLTTKSKWADESAGGCPPNFATWRCNPQWLLRTSKPVRLTVSLSVPAPTSADGSTVPMFTPEAAIGVSVVLGNSGADARRRKLLLTSPEELVVRAEPRPVRRLVTQIELEPSETPYVVIPHTYMPGREMPFTMTVRADDTDEDGEADFTFEPIRAGTDWHHASEMRVWSKELTEVNYPADESDDEEDEQAPAPAGAGASGGPPGSAGFEGNPQITLTVEKAGRFFIFVDQIGKSPDDAYPAVGAAVVPNPAAFEDGKITLDELLLHEQPQANDSLVFACELAAADTPYCIMPYLADTLGALEANPQLAFRLSVYSDAPFSLGDAKSAVESVKEQCGMRADGTCICWGYGRYPDKQSESNCVVLRCYNALKRMERGMDKQLKYLDTLVPTVVHEKMRS